MYDIKMKFNKFVEYMQTKTATKELKITEDKVKTLKKSPLKDSILKDLEQKKQKFVSK